MVELSSLLPGETGRIVRVDPSAPACRRLLDLGFTPGAAVLLTRTAPLGDPLEVRLRGFSLTLRREDAQAVTVSRAAWEGENAAGAKTPARSFLPCSGCPGCTLQQGTARSFSAASGKSTVALIGNPNCGKSTLFNLLTGGRAHVGNWPGVTVEKRVGQIKEEFCGGAESLHLADLPGVYGLSPFSLEEQAAREFLLRERPALIVDLLDGSCPMRGLYLTLQLLELETPLALLINCMEGAAPALSPKRLSSLLGVPAAALDARSGKGAEAVQQILIQRGSTVPVSCTALYESSVSMALLEMQALLRPFAKKAGLPPAFAAARLLEGEEALFEELALPEDTADSVRKSAALFAAGGFSGTAEKSRVKGYARMAAARWQAAERLSAAARREEPILSIPSTAPRNHSGAGRDKRAAPVHGPDRVALHPRWGPLLLVLLLGAIFCLTFAGPGAWLSGEAASAVNSLASRAAALLSSVSSPPWLTALITEGLLPGVGSAAAFLPQLTLLYLALALLEDSGYLSRAAFLLDRPMRRVGLSGRSAVALLLGFGCTVPAAMATRTSGSLSEKRRVLLLLPFMSCSAKLPVYSLLSSAFFPEKRLAVLVTLYLSGVLLGFGAACVGKRIFPGREPVYLLELPPYRLPLLKNVLLSVGERVGHFLSRAGTLLVAVSLALWLLQRFTPSFSQAQSPEVSLLGCFGRLSAPLLSPLGFGTWQAAAALFAGLAAKEAVAGALAQLCGYTANGALALAAVFPTPRAALAFLVFVLLYPPCAAGTLTLCRELRLGRLALLQPLLQLMIAYLAALAVFSL